MSEHVRNLETRRRVKEQQKRVFKSEFKNTHFSFTLGADGTEQFVSTPELHSDEAIERREQAATWGALAILQPAIWRSLGPEARFVGLGLSVPTKEDLQKLSKISGRPVGPANTPGGGSVVHLRDPEGVAVDVLRHGDRCCRCLFIGEVRK